MKSRYKDPRGGLTAAGRAYFKRTEGANLKPPAPNPRTARDAGRKKSFCARNGGQIRKFNIDCRRTPEKRACKARRRWACR